MEQQKLTIDQITPGMKLAEAVTNAAGVTLMPAGIRLTPMFINRLKKWNIASLSVFVDRVRTGKTDVTPVQRASAPAASAPATAAMPQPDEFARQIAREVAGWFINLRDNPLMMQLRNTAIKRLVAHGKNGMINVMRKAARDESGGEA